VSDSKQIVGKLLFFLVLGVVALAAGFYLSGYVTVVLLKLQGVSLKWNTWLQYYHAMNTPQFLPYAKKIQISGAIGFGLPLLIWAAMAILALMPKRQSLHGDARFAGGGDLAAKDMFKPHKNGIVIGKFGGKIVRLGGQQFVILAAPTRSGKGVGVVIPNLLDYQESMVVLDIKQENFDLTSGWRKSIGHEIYLFNPFAEDRRSHRWNPLTYVSADPAFRVSDLMSIAAMLTRTAPRTRSSGSARRATRSWRSRCICSKNSTTTRRSVSRSRRNPRWARSIASPPATAKASSSRS